MTDLGEYLRAWRRAHPERQAQYSRAYRRRLTRPADVERVRTKSRERTQRRRASERDLNRLQQRMLQRGRPVTTEEGRELLAEYGPHYPLSRGLTDEQRRWLRRQKDHEGRAELAHLLTDAEKGAIERHFETDCEERPDGDGCEACMKAEA